MYINAAYGEYLKVTLFCNFLSNVCMDMIQIAT